MIKYEVPNSAFKSTCSFAKLSEYLMWEVQSCTGITVSTKPPNVMELCVFDEKLYLEEN